MEEQYKSELKAFFEELKPHVQKNESMPHLISEILNISTDSAYRRMRGETPLLFNEMMQICDYFKCTYAYGKEKNEKHVYRFSYKSFYDQISTFENLISCLRVLKTNLSYLSTSPDAKVSFSLTDLPIFFFYQSSDLINFRLRIWYKEVLGKNLEEELNYEQKLKEVQSVLTDIFEALKDIECHLIWSNATLDSLLESVSYYKQAGEIEKEQTNLLFEELSGLINFFYKESDSSDFKWKIFLSEVELSNGYMLLESAALDFRFSAIKLFSINSINSTEEKIFSDIKQWFEILIKNSVLISSSNRKQRHRFFSRLIEKIQKKKNYLQSLEELDL